MYNPIAMIEDTNLHLLKLCSLMTKIQTQEVRLTRARYKVSYFRKIRSAIATKGKCRNPMPDGYLKWRDNPRGLEKQIEQLRLAALKVQEQSIAVSNQLRLAVNRTLQEANAALVFKDGKVIGITVGKGGNYICADRFTDLADQYEATVAMNKVLNL